MKLLRQIKDFFIENWRETLLLLNLSGLVTLVYYFTYARPDETYLQAFMIIGAVAFAALSMVLIRLLWKKKWKNATTERLQRVFGRLQRLIERISTKFGLSQSTKKSVLSGKTRIIFEKGSERETVRSSAEAKQPKWGRLRDDRAKMRYLYRGMISEKIRRGESVYRFETPSELALRKENSASEQELFDMYISCRYDERIAADGERVAELKKELGIK